MTIALVTCEDLPTWEIDDAALHEALRARGAAFRQPIWSDPNETWGSDEIVLLRTPWDYHRRLPEFLRWAEGVDQVTQLLNPLAVIEWNAHKRYLLDLKQRGVPVVPSMYLRAGSDAACVRTHALAIGGEWNVSRAVLKPAVSATAWSTLPFDLDEAGLAAGEAHARDLLPEHDLLLQPWCSAVLDEGEYSIIVIDGQRTHCVRKVPKAGDFRVQNDYGAHDEPWSPSPEALGIAEQIETLLPADVLYARIDLLRGPDGSLRLSELELIEPSLFFRHSPEAADRLAEALLARRALRMDERRGR